MVRDVIFLRTKSSFFLFLSFFLAAIYGFLNFIALKIYFYDQQLSELLVRISLFISALGILFAYLSTVLIRRKHISIVDLPIIMLISWLTIERSIGGKSLFYVADGIVYRAMVKIHGTTLITSIVVMLGFLFVAINMFYNLKQLMKKKKGSFLIYLSMITILCEAVGIVIVILSFIFNPSIKIFELFNSVIIISSIMYAIVIIKYPEISFVLLQNTYFIHIFTKNRIEVFSINSGNNYYREKLRYILQMLGNFDINIMEQEYIIFDIGKLKAIIHFSDDFIIAVGTDNPLDIHFRTINAIMKKLKRSFAQGIIIVSNETRELIKKLIIDDIKYLLVLNR